MPIGATRIEVKCDLRVIKVKKTFAFLDSPERVEIKDQVGLRPYFSSPDPSPVLYTCTNSSVDVFEFFFGGIALDVVPYNENSIRVFNPMILHATTNLPND